MITAWSQFKLAIVAAAAGATAVLVGFSAVYVIGDHFSSKIERKKKERRKNLLESQLLERERQLEAFKAKNAESNVSS